MDDRGVRLPTLGTTLVEHERGALGAEYGSAKNDRTTFPFRKVFDRPSRTERGEAERWTRVGTAADVPVRGME